MIMDQYSYDVQPDRLNYGTMEHVLEKGSAYRWQIARGKQRAKNGNDVSFTWSHLKNDESNTSAMWN